MNPRACAAQAREILAKAGLDGRDASRVVTGDDLLPRLDELLAAGHTLNHLDTGEPLATIRDKVVSANAYLGAKPIVEALQQGADVVITGRVADASLTVGPAVHEFGWGFGDRTSTGSRRRPSPGTSSSAARRPPAACGSTRTTPRDLDDVGYPIAEIAEDGTFTITKPDGTGGAVNVETVSEQLLYEVGDPARYYTPDVVADFTSVQADADRHRTW